MDRTLLLAFLGLLAAALALYVFAHYQRTRYAWVPVKIPISLVADTVVRVDFTADTNARYNLALDTRRDILEFREHNCLLGIGMPPVAEECRPQVPEVALTWAVSARGTDIASGTAAGWAHGYWGPSIGRFLGDFEGKKGTRYTIGLAVHTTSTTLQRTNPMLMVRIGGAVFQNAHFLATVAAHAALALAASCLVPVGWLLARRLVPRRTPRH